MPDANLPSHRDAPSRQRPSTLKPTASHELEPPLRRPSLFERLRAATSRRPSATDGQPWRDRDRPSLIAKAKGLLTNHRPSRTSDEESLYPPPELQTFRRLPDQLSRQEIAASDHEKLRLSVEAATPFVRLLSRWKNPADWLTPSAYWRRTHPALNFHLCRIVQRDPRNRWQQQAAAETSLIEAKTLYEQHGGDSEEWWPSDLEEKVLDAWASAYGGQDPPDREWKLRLGVWAPGSFPL